MDTVRQILRTSLRWVSVAAVCAVVAAGCATPPPGTAPPPTLPTLPTAPSSTPAKKPTGPLLAYRAAGEIGIVDGTEVVASAPGSFVPSGDPVITEDGRFVFGHATDGDVVAIEVATKKTTVVPVPPGARIGTAGGSVLVWLEAPGRLMQTDLADPGAGATQRQQITLPDVPDSPAPRLLAARGGTVVVARVESAPTADGGPETLYAVRGDTAPTSLGATEADTPVSTAALSPDGSQLAYGQFRPTGDACGTAAVAVSDAAGAQQTFDVATPDAATGSRVTHLWWQKGQPMALSLATWRCEPASYYAPLVWEFSDARLVEAQPRTVALQTAVVEPGQRALIIPTGATAPESSGTLVLEDSGRRLPIKPGVDAIDVIPAPGP